MKTRHLLGHTILLAVHPTTFKYNFELIPQFKLYFYKNYSQKI